MKRVYLSLGSNLGDRKANIAKGLEELGVEGIQAMRVSSLYKTEPVGYRAQPWFLNCAAEVATSLMPLQLLHKCQAIERRLGRRRTIAQGPRVIDIDILLYENSVVRSAALMIPHPRMTERRFVLVPLREIAPNLRHPVSQRTVLAMLEEADDTSQVTQLSGLDRG